MVIKSQTTEWPGGLAWQLTVLLKQKYQPKDRISRVEMRSDLNAIKMRINDDPALLFEKISKIGGEVSNMRIEVLL